MKRKISLALTLVPIVVLLFVIISNFQEIVDVEWNFGLAEVFLLIIATLLVHFLNVLAWHETSKSFGSQISFIDNAKVWTFSNVARLLPGGIWQYPSRILHFSNKGQSRLRGASVLTAETVLNLATGSVISLVALGIWELPGELSRAKPLLWIFLLSPLLIIVVFSKRISQKLSLIAGRHLPARLSQLRLDQIVWKSAPKLIFIYALGFIANGVVLFILLSGTGSVEFSDFLVVVGMFSLAWLLGYIAIFAPAGIGVTEISLATFLSVFTTFSAASVIAIALRVVLFFGEFTFLLTLSLHNRIVKANENSL